MTLLFNLLVPDEPPNVWGGMDVDTLCAGVIAPACYAIIGAFLLQGLPAIFTRPGWQSAAVWRLAGLFTGAAFYFTWLQVRMTVRQRHAMLYLILSAAVVQALIVLLQLFAQAIAQYWIQSGSPARLWYFSAT